MELEIPLDKMSTAEKLKAMEILWEDLQRSQESIPSPSWHADVLHARDRRVREGVSSFVDWPDSKKKIRKMTE